MKGLIFSILTYQVPGVLDEISTIVEVRGYHVDIFEEGFLVAEGTVFKDELPGIRVELVISVDRHDLGVHVHLAVLLLGTVHEHDVRTSLGSFDDADHHMADAVPSAHAPDYVLNRGIRWY